MIKIAPSILSADFGNLAEEIKKIEEAGADLLHIDVMDGHFVPNITMGPLVVKAVKKITKLPLDVHLMISNPDKYIKNFADAGSDVISFHAEAVSNPAKTILEIEKYGKAPALAINPDNSFEKYINILDKFKMILLMTVFPGFEGQKFIPSVLPNIKSLRNYIEKSKLNIDIEVDGGINETTAKEVISAGANILVAGSAIFYSKDYRLSISDIRGTHE